MSGQCRSLMEGFVKGCVSCGSTSQCSVTQHHFTRRGLPLIGCLAHACSPAPRCVEALPGVSEAPPPGSAPAALRAPAEISPPRPARRYCSK
ncbi:hypothetical protein SRHO_G00046940 [Serrasalmus rhombeus]